MALDVNRLRRERLYERSATLDQLAADLTSLESLAVNLRASRKRLQLAGTVTLIAGLIGLALFFPVGLALLAIGVYLFVRVKSYPKVIANNLPRCAMGKSVTAMLSHDVHPEKPAALRLAFDPERQILAETELPHRKNGKQKLFKIPWFSMETDLHDGTTFTETVDDLVRQRSFTTARGKSKTKTRTHSLLAMRFAYRSKVYGDLTGMNVLMEREILLPPSAKVRGLEVTGRVVKVKALVTKSEDLARASSMLALGVYRIMNLSREKQKGGK